MPPQELAGQTRPGDRRAQLEAHICKSGTLAGERLQLARPVQGSFASAGILDIDGEDHGAPAKQRRKHPVDLSQREMNHPRIRAEKIQLKIDLLECRSNRHWICINLRDGVAWPGQAFAHPEIRTLFRSGRSSPEGRLRNGQS
jgi:hypothetical protein